MILAVTYGLVTTGLLVLAFDYTLFDRVATVVFAAIVIVVLGAILATGWPPLWLAVGGLWMYETVIVAVRAVDPYQRAGLALICLGIAFGALAAYVVADRHLI
jgi:hypothetical membrane protein